MVDVERLVSGYLRGKTEISDLVADRVYTEIPSRATFPLVRLSLIGGAPRFSQPLYLDEAVIQIDAYGGPKVQARQIVDAVRSVLADEWFRTRHDLGVVSDVQFGQLSYIPDDTFDPAKPRYVAEVSFIVHP